MWAFVGVLVSAAFRRTWLRTEDWSTYDTLFAAAIRVCPNSAKMHQQYGQILLNAENVSGAFVHFRRAKSIDPQFCDVDFNLGMAYAGRKDYGNAVRVDSAT